MHLLPSSIGEAEDYRDSKDNCLYILLMENRKARIRGVLGTDARILFPMIHGTVVTDTIVWDGPPSLEEYEKGLAQRELQHNRGEVHFFTITSAGEDPVGTITIRPQNEFRADIGLWIGEKYHGHGFGTEAVKLITNYGFETLNLQKIEASVFVGNIASRRIFEKNGYSLEGTIRSAIKKRNKFLDEWFLGIVRESSD